MAKERPPLEEMTLRQLRKVASEFGISRYSRMRKSQLLTEITTVQKDQFPSSPSPTLEAQETVEAAKFELGQEDQISVSLASVDEGLTELPSGYGDSRIVLLPRDPQWAYAYWDISNEHKEMLRRQGGQQLALRIYDVTDISLPYQSPHSIQEYPCDELAREWYLPIPVSDRDYVVDIGYRTPEGRWLILSRSETIHIPPIYPSDWVDDQYLTIAWDEDLRGKTYLELVPSGKRSAVKEKIHEEIFDLAEVAEAQRVDGSLYGSMQQVPEQALSSYALSSYITASGVGQWAVPTESGLVTNLSGIGLTASGVGLTESGIGLTASGIGLTESGIGLTASGIGLTASGIGLTASGVGLTASGAGWITASGIGLTASGIGLTASGAGLTASGAGWITASGVGLTASGVGLTASGIGLTASGIGLTASGIGWMTSGAGLTASGIGLTASGIGLTASGAGWMTSGAGLTASGAGWMTSGAGLTASGAGLTASGVGLTASGAGWMTSGAGLTASGAGLTASGAGLTASGAGWMTSGMGLTASGAGLTASGAGLTASGAGWMTSGMGLTASGAGLTASGTGLTASGAGWMTSGAGLTASGAGLTASGAGLTASGAGWMTSGIGLRTTSGMGMSGVGFSASAVPIRPRQFWLVADAELIVYGATEPDATVTIGGRPIKLNPDGTFRFQMSFQDGLIDYPIMAVAVDGEQTRSIQMRFTRETPSRHTNTKQEAVEEWLVS